ncbi:MAG: glycosyltransferase family 2 protein [Armatimonadetes bacterium]|nr:glycosyltransferase family 2 protein [Armatimonadota bacterium]
MDLRIAIVNYNTRDLLDACLSSIEANPPDGEYEVVVVDNASRDDSAAMVRERHPAVTVIASDANLGYAAGNNRALEGSRARYFLILNSDTEVHPGCLQALIDFMDAHPRVGMCGARLILPDGSIQPSCATELTLRKYLTQQMLLDKAGLSGYLFGDYWVDVAHLSEPTEAEQLTGACMFCRREAVEQLGGMDEGYWMYCEDSDYCQRYRAAGWLLYYVPQATLLHVLGGSSKTARAEMIAAYNHGAARYFRRHRGPAPASAAKLIGLAGGLLRLLLWGLPMLATLGLVGRFRRPTALFAKTLWLTLLPPRRPRR